MLFSSFQTVHVVCKFVFFQNLWLSLSFHSGICMIVIAAMAATLVSMAERLLATPES